MRFNETFKAKYKILKRYDDNNVQIAILDTNGFSCEVKKCNLHNFYVCAYTGDIYTSDCVFYQNDKVGYYMKNLSIPVLEVPSTEDELIKYTASQIKGVSKDTMKRIVNYFGIDFVNMLNEHPEEINKIQLRDAQKEAILKWCEGHADLSIITTNAYLYGIEPTEIFEIYDMYGFKAIKMIEQDPYTLYMYNLIDLKKIDNIAIKNGIPANSVNRVAAYIYYLISNYEDDGCMAVRKTDVDKYITKNSFDNEYSEALEYLINNKFIKTVKFDNDEEYIGKTVNLNTESSIARYLSRVDEDSGYSRDVIERAFKGNELNKQQREAVFGCLSKKISLLTGGPGTGKTFTIKRIIRTIKNINPNIKISLMAPTGKAAGRMIEVIKLEATTIHCAFGINEGDNLLRKEGMILDEDLIIVDEASMIDETLFGYMVKHISDKTQLILVGDTGQLPSVGAGNLLESLSSIVPNYELTTICRQDKTSKIVLNAHHIRNKEFNKIEFDDKEFCFIETKKIVDTVKELYKKYCNTYNPEDIMILSPQKDKNGTNQINAGIQENNPYEVVKTDERNIYKKYDRVIQTKNVKKLKIHNGDQGYVGSDSEKGLWVFFDGIDDPVDVTDLKHLDLAYAITVHKSQGSEADLVIMIFNEAHMFSLSKKLIYTALTRTKSKFIGVGASKDLLIKGCQKEEKERISLIKKYYENFIKSK